MHKEDIKAALRKKHGSLRAFEVDAGVPHDSVRDVLRGRSIARTESAISDALEKPLQELFPRRYARSSTKRDDIAIGGGTHGLSAEAR